MAGLRGFGAEVAADLAGPRRRRPEDLEDLEDLELADFAAWGGFAGLCPGSL